MSLAQAGRWGGRLLTPGEEDDDGDDEDDDGEDGGDKGDHCEEDNGGDDGDQDAGDEDDEVGLQHLVQGESLKAEDRIFH